MIEEHSSVVLTEPLPAAGLEAGDGVVQLTVRDDGEGLPEGFSVDRDQGLGLQLISTIAQNEFAGRFITPST